MSKKHYTVVRIDAETWRIEEGSGPSKAYMYLLTGSEKAALIDTGFGRGNLHALTASLTKLPVFVVNTHGHIDHISGNYQFDHVYLPAQDKVVFEEDTSYSCRLDLVLALLKERRLPKFLVKLPVVHSKIKQFCTVPKCSHIELFEDGIKFDLGGRTLEVIATPGHTGGSVCLLEERRGYLFSGDTVCAEGILLGNNHSLPVETYLKSVKRLEQRSSDFHTLWPAHHIVPLSPDFINDYITCSESILSGELVGEWVQTAGGTGFIVKKNRVAITYRKAREQ
jgi:hydroxyacylglutathione hydrolase